LVTSEKYKIGLNENNLIVWDTKTDGRIIRAFEWNASAKDGAKSIKFDPEEKFCARQISKNLVEIYDTANFAEPKFEIKSKLPPLPKVDGLVQEDSRVDNSKYDGFLFCPMPAESKALASAPYYFMAW
jgi:uncharacterized protein with WD repeat